MPNKRSGTYNTKQGAAILAYIASLDGAHVTAAQIVRHFASAERPVGRTTIYRYLDKLTANGHLRRYAADGQGACYQQADCGGVAAAHYHLKCEQCGLLLHLSCDTLCDMRRHMLDEHVFRLNEQKTVLYGTCRDCL